MEYVQVVIFVNYKIWGDACGMACYDDGCLVSLKITIAGVQFWWHRTLVGKPREFRNMFSKDCFTGHFDYQTCIPLAGFLGLNSP